MKQCFIETFVLTILCINFIYGQEKVEVDGALIIGNSDDVSPVPGTLRWTGLNFEGWNGFVWLPLAPFQVNQIISDIDGNDYRTVMIGGTEWMAENLRTTRYKNGDLIPEVTNNTDWGNLGSGAYCWYENSASYETPYGKLYNWFAVNDTRGICPDGWTVPTKDVKDQMTNFLGGIGVAGAALKETGTTHWNPNVGATNTSGFTGIPGGWRGTNGVFDRLTTYGFWWTATESITSTNALFFDLYAEFIDLLEYDDSKKYGLSVRCVKN